LPSGLSSDLTFDFDLNRSLLLRANPVAHDGKSPIATLEVGRDLGAATAATLADEPRLEIGQPQIVRPAI